MKKLRRAEDRGHANHGWLDSYHTFSFANYYNPDQMGFRALRVINDDTVLGGGGFDTHPHRDMEIISYVLSGALKHRDSMGTEAVMKAGDFQRISAGTGVHHSEYNYSPIDPVHFLQIWIVPDRKGAAPNYAEKSFANAPLGALNLVASKSGRDGSIPINQDADLYLAKLAERNVVTHVMRPGRHAWVHLAEGEALVNGEQLKAGDALALSEETELRIEATKPSQALVFDLN
ncbi:MAG TPA: pirin family protein [Methylomirabilota bacterium]|nr:pirin family protein [Methylomirabilota bacterium]